MNWPTNAWWADMFGGLMNLRIFHYFMMYVFIIFIFIHVYLANVEGVAPTALMFFHKEHGGLVYDPDRPNLAHLSHFPLLWFYLNYFLSAALGAADLLRDVDVQWGRS